MFKNLMGKAKSAAEKIDLKSSLDAAKKSTAENLTATKTKAKDIFDKNWPRFEEVIVKGLINITEEKLKDDKSLTAAFEKAYELLPVPVRLVLSRDNFLNFCMLKREPLLEKVQKFKENNTRPLEQIGQESIDADASPKLINKDDTLANTGQ